MLVNVKLIHIWTNKLDSLSLCFLGFFSSRIFEANNFKYVVNYFRDINRVQKEYRNLEDFVAQQVINVGAFNIQIWVDFAGLFKGRRKKFAQQQ